MFFFVLFLFFWWLFCFVLFCVFLVGCFLDSFDFVGDVGYDEWWIVSVLLVGLERLFVVSTGVTGGLKRFACAFFQRIRNTYKVKGFPWFA